MSEQSWKHQFSIEFRPVGTPHMMPEGARWFRTHNRQGYKPFYVRGEDADVVFATAYGCFRAVVDKLPEWAMAVRLVERKGTEFIEHSRYFPNADPEVKGAGMNWCVVRMVHADMGELEDKIDALKEEYDKRMTFLVDESLKRRAAALNDEYNETLLTTEHLESGRVVVGRCWECEDIERNVWGLCVYDDDEDPAHDDCIFCHAPEERK